MKTTIYVWRHDTHELVCLTKTYTYRYHSQITEKLQLPTKAFAEETSQIIDGKLLEMSKEPHNIQIELEIRAEEECILLRDMDGVFCKSNCM